MKRMKKYSYILLALPLLLGSCEAYLDVNPKSEVTDKELFSTAEGCEDAIYGIYTEMGTNKNLFAYALTFAYPELMATSPSARATTWPTSYSACGSTKTPSR